VTPPQILDDWLDPNTTETQDVQALLDSVPPPVLVPTPVSTDVNSLSNNNPSLTKPVEESGDAAYDATSDYSTTMKGKKRSPAGGLLLRLMSAVVLIPLLVLLLIASGVKVRRH
jgi:hypothetical protein